MIALTIPTPPLCALGIDPGTNTGAGVVLDVTVTPARVVRAMAWQIRKLKRGPVTDVWTSDHGVGEAFAPIWLWVKDLCAAAVNPACAVEGFRFQGMAQGDPVPKATQAGRIAGWVEAFTGCAVARPYAHDWRRDVMGLSNKLKGADADAAILASLPALVTLPPDVPAWAMKHLPDACGVALYAAMEKP